MVTLAIYPDNFTEEQETTIQIIVGLAEDPDMKAGETEVVRSAHNACTVVSYQVWLDKNGKEIKRKKVSTSNFRAYKKRIAVGTLLDNGKHAKLDTKTGKLIGA